MIDYAALGKLSSYEAIGVYLHSFEYGDCPSSIMRVFMPVKKTGDKEWLQRMRVHLTLTI